MQFDNANTHKIGLSTLLVAFASLQYLKWIVGEFTLSTPPVWCQLLYLGYIPGVLSIGLPPSQHDIHTLLVSSLVVIS